MEWLGLEQIDDLNNEQWVGLEDANNYQWVGLEVLEIIKTSIKTFVTKNLNYNFVSKSMKYTFNTIKNSYNFITKKTG